MHRILKICGRFSEATAAAEAEAKADAKAEAKVEAPAEAKAAGEAVAMAEAMVEAQAEAKAVGEAEAKAVAIEAGGAAMDGYTGTAVSRPCPGSCPLTRPARHSPLAHSRGREQGRLLGGP